MHIRYDKLFIVGSGRSGTTWTYQIFANHPSVISPASPKKAYNVIGPKRTDPWVNESKVYETIGPLITPGEPRGLGEKIERGIRRVVQHLKAERPDVALRNIAALVRFHLGKKTLEGTQEYMLQRYDSFDLGTRLQAIVSRQEFVAFIDEAKKLDAPVREQARMLIDRIFDNFFQKNKGKHGMLFVEKTPNHLFFADEMLRHYPEAKVIVLLRDGRDVCVSIQKVAEKGTTWMQTGRKAQMLYWKKSADASLALIKNESYKGRVLAVKYEDMTANPVGEIKRMLHFAGLKTSPAIVKRIIQQTDVKKLIGKNENVHKGGPGGWHESFSEEDHALFKKLCGDTFEQLGYEY